MYTVHMKYKLYQTNILLFFLVFNLENTFSERTFFWKGGNLFTTFFYNKNLFFKPIWYDDSCDQIYFGLFQWFEDTSRT